MQKKCLLLMMVFSCIAQAIVIDNEQSAPKDPYANLREDLRIVRNDPDNAIYADKMIDGIEAIKNAKEAKKKCIGEDRQALKDKVSGNQSRWGSEPKGTLVHNAFEEIEDELNQYTERHSALADIYAKRTLFMHNDLSNNAQQDLAEAVHPFKTMERALRLCQLGDHACYKRYGAQQYSEMVDPNYRRNIQEEHCQAALKAAHEQNIPVTANELRVIMRKNVAYNKTMSEIEELDASIEDLVNPEKIKEREEKRIKDLEDQLKKDNASIDNKD